MKNRIKNISVCCFLIIAFNSYSQILCEETKEKITLSSGNVVYVYQEKNTHTAPVYYYVPTQLNISQSKGKPEYSFLEYKNAGSTTPDGAIFHLLITWGLNTNDLKELKKCIKNLYGSNVILSGATYLDNKNARISINTNTKPGLILNKSLKSKGVPPTLSSGKMALSFKLKKEDAKIISEAINNRSGFNKTILKINYSFNANTCISGLSIAKKNNITVKGHLQKWF